MCCRICKNSLNNKTYQIKEMMFGLRDEFTYLECSKCGCLQITEIPKNMERYYPSDYYSFQEREPPNFVKRFLKIRGGRYAVFSMRIIGNMLYRRCPDNILIPIAKTGVNCKSKILDVGCGSGKILYSLRDLGFKNLSGIDPYIDREVEERHIRILKHAIHDLPDTAKFDLILFNHSFEHVNDQLMTLLKVSGMLAEKGVCLIRIPLKTEYIWSRYGVDWVQIDAPRHFFIHTVNSFGYLISEAGLKIEEVVFDSTAFQFWGSEQNRMDIPLRDNNSYDFNPKSSIFTRKQIQDFAKLAGKLNRLNQGDQAAFYLVANAK